ncbi:MAG: AAA family ATPase, partial [Bdellovibrionales bacterium]
GYQVRDYSMKALNTGYLQILQAENLGEFVAQRFNDNPDLLEELTIDFHEEFGRNSNPGDAVDKNKQIAEALVGSTRFTPRDEEIIQVTVTARSPVAAAQGANLMSDMASAYLFNYEAKEVADIETFLAEKLNQSQKQIDLLNKELEDFKGKQSIVNLSQQGVFSMTQQTIAKLREELEMVDVKLQQNRTVIDKIEGDLGLAEGSDSEIRTLRGRILDRYRLLKDERVGLQATKSALSKRIRELQKSLKPQFEERVFEFTRKLQAEHELYQELKKQLANLNVFRISLGSRVWKYTSADLTSASRQSPLARKLLLSVALSLALLILVVYAEDQVRPVISDREDLKFLGIRYLGSIPVIDDRPKGGGYFQRLFAGRRRRKGIQRKELPGGRAGLAFQILRTKILRVFRSGRKPSSVVAVMSPRAGDGKSFLCVNLAIALGRFKIKTLIVDCDIVKNSSTRFFAVEGAPGLVEYIEQGAQLENLIQESNYADVRFLPAGGTRPHFDLLASGRFRELLVALREQYDVIVLDLPAFAGGPESAFIANEADYSLLVMSAYETKFREISELLDNLDPQKLSEVYGVLNRHESSVQTGYNNPYIIRAEGQNESRGIERASS